MRYATCAPNDTPCWVLTAGCSGMGVEVTSTSSAERNDETHVPAWF